MTVQELYGRTIRPLSATDRLALAKLILNDIPAEAVADYQDSWSDEDLRDFSRTGWSRAEVSVGEGDNG